MVVQDAKIGLKTKPFDSYPALAYSSPYSSPYSSSIAAMLLR
jgi:hypothetical protein